MPKYVIERDIPGAGKLTPAQLKGISQTSCGVLNKLGPSIQWLQSYVTDDKVYCVYIAPNRQLIEEHARLLDSAERVCAATTKAGRPLLDSPRTQQRLARCAAHVAAAEMLHCRTLWVEEEGRPDPACGPASKLFSAEVYRADACELLNLTAPESLASDSQDTAYINWCYRHSQVATVYGGTSEIHRSMVAERALGLPKSRD